MSCPKSDLIDCLPPHAQAQLGDYADADEVMIEAEDHIQYLQDKVNKLLKYMAEIRDGESAGDMYDIAREAIHYMGE
jgi:hypothetical protein